MDFQEHRCGLIEGTAEAFTWKDYKTTDYKLQPIQPESCRDLNLVLPEYMMQN
jgi:hypothetical protein